jgi:hypothetical protein
VLLLVANQAQLSLFVLQVEAVVAQLTAVVVVVQVDSAYQLRLHKVHRSQ